MKERSQTTGDLWPRLREFPHSAKSEDGLTSAITPLLTLLPVCLYTNLRTETFKHLDFRVTYRHGRLPKDTK
jgi:hypothetical protein